MRGRFFNRNDDDSGTIFRDILFLMIGVISAALLIELMQPNNPKTEQDEAYRRRGNLRVEVLWPDHMNADIDTWVKAPGLPPVGYSNMNGPVLNLVRDDLGAYADITGINYETVFSRGLPPGEWVVNVHWFSNTGNHVRVPVKVFVTMRKSDEENSKDGDKKIITTEIILTSVGQEYTVIRFRLDDDGDLIPSSMNSIPSKIRPVRNPSEGQSGNHR